MLSSLATSKFIKDKIKLHNHWSLPQSLLDELCAANRSTVEPLITHTYRETCQGMGFKGYGISKVAPIT